MNKQSTARAPAHRNGLPRDEGEDARRVQLIEVTIDSLAEVGYVGTTLAEIAGRA
ncbi:MAG: TetR family transcriptional regulator, partial [Gammaproteobacteria bacterium]|nr:TetR family transcriptional regulator [Gammaproteobacteria bacterium]